MPESGFHFTQPYWFLGLLALPLVAFWRWRSATKAAQSAIQRYADGHLLPYLTGVRTLRRSERWGRFLTWSLLWLLLLTALAGPRWDYASVQLFHPGDNLLILLDLSRSMDATDTAPSRLGRARQEIQDLIVQNRRLRLGLIAFASVPHVISPVTEDSRALLLALPALSSGLAQLQGSRFQAALERAEQLLDALPAESAKAMVLISDGDFDEAGLEEQVRALAERGMPLHVLGVGTLEGAEVPGERGALVDPNGVPVRTRLDEAQLQALAAAGRGLYQRADYRDADTRAILEVAAQSRLPAAASTDRTRIWHERFYLPIALLLLLLLPRFRGWLGPRRGAGGVAVPLLAAPLLFTATPPAQAGWFSNTEQEAIAAYEDGAYATAAAAFSDPFRRGAALYRAGRYAEAEAAFAEPQRAAVRTAARYNLGNARFAQSDYAGAVSAYEQVLSAEPTHDDALHNLALARARLARLEQETFAEEQQPEPEEAPEETPEAGADAQDDAEASDAPSEQSQPQEASEQQQSAESSQEQSGEQQQEQQQDESSPQEQGDEQQDAQQQGQQQGQQSSAAGEQQGEAEDQDQDPGQGQTSASEAGSQPDGERDGDEQRESQEDAEGDEHAETAESSGDDGRGREKRSEGEPEVEEQAGASERQEREQSGAGGDDEERAGGDEQGADQRQRTDSSGEDRTERGLDAEPDAANPDLGAADQAAKTIDRFDQQGAQPWQTLDPEKGLSDRPSLDGEAMIGAGSAVMEQRLQQVEGDPTRLMRNQFRLEEARHLRDSGGRLQEPRPW